MDALTKLRKTSIRATDVAAQYWCERQMELNYLYGAKITKEIKKGRALHEELEAEVNVPIVLMPKSYPDVLYKILYTSSMALDALVKNKKAREIQIYGMANGFRLVGKIDQLEIRDGETIVWEDKTRSTDNIPNEPQLLTHKAQVMLYRKMIEDLQKGAYTLEDYRKENRTQFQLITPEFARQLDALSVEKSLQTVDAAARGFFERISKLPKVGNDLHIRYINQLTGKEIKIYKFTYDEKRMDQMLGFILKYWKGERESLPVPKEEAWKCNYCSFFGKECKVWFPQKKLATDG